MMTALTLAMLFSPPVSADSSRPVLIASIPAGTRIDVSIRAGSLGWSFEGNHQAALSGSPAAVHSEPVVHHGCTLPCRRSPGLPA